MSMVKRVAVWLVIILVIVAVEKKTGIFTKIFTLNGKFKNPLLG